MLPRPAGLNKTRIEEPSDKMSDDFEMDIFIMISDTMTSVWLGK